MLYATETKQNIISNIHIYEEIKRYRVVAVVTMNIEQLRIRKEVLIINDFRETRHLQETELIHIICSHLSVQNTTLGINPVIYGENFSTTFILTEKILWQCDCEFENCSLNKKRFISEKLDPKKKNPTPNPTNKPTQPKNNKNV
ncbi:hypothetical protein J6590_004078 [Homalodisca vitripennis]|nr:hypothetical protein J6590_004078 [Homalodisca vitripennis]